ncbi:MAG TPA: fibronectin type III domain-containing protein, partial [Kribbella sp.]|nr:fibronectin type III domain-containing protein [Kribbella sp.]
QTVLDRDNMTLTYFVCRGSTRIGSWSRTSNSWTKAAVTSVTDSGLTSGQKLAYHVEVSDGRNVRKGPATTVRVR